MKLKRNVIATIFAAFILTVMVGTAAAQSKPKVVIIKADWCSACQKLDPTMMGLMKEYGDRLDFVVLDVTTDESTAMAMSKAKSIGILSFFNQNKKNTATVAIIKGKKVGFNTRKNFDRDTYVREFEKAIK